MMKLVGTEIASDRGVVERRRGLRIERNHPIKVFEPTSVRYIGGRTYDVSATGLKIELPISTNVAPGRLVSVHVGLGDGGAHLANRRSMIPARVVWVDRSNPSGGRLLAGVEFLVSSAARLDAA